VERRGGKNLSFPNEHLLGHWHDLITDLGGEKRQVGGKERLNYQILPGSGGRFLGNVKQGCPQNQIIFNCTFFICEDEGEDEDEGEGEEGEGEGGGGVEEEQS